MNEIKETIILDDSQFITGLEEIAKQAGVTEKQWESMLNTMSTGTKKAGDIVSKTNETVSKSIDKSVGSMRQSRQELKTQIKDFSILGISLGSIQKKYDDLKKILGLTIKGFIGSTKVTRDQVKASLALNKSLGGGLKGFLALARGANILKVALLSTGIGAIVLALGGLITFMTSTQKGMNKVKIATAGLGAGFNVLKGRVAGVGQSILKSFEQGTVLKDFGSLLKNQVLNRIESIKTGFDSVGSLIKNVFSGNLSEAKENLKDMATSAASLVTGFSKSSIDNFVSDTEKAVVSVRALEKREISLAKTRRDLAANTSKLRFEINELKLAGEDTTKTYDKRAASLQKAYTLEKSLLDQQTAAAKEQLSIIRLQNKEKGNLLLDTDLDKEKDAITQLNDFRAESAEKRKELNNQINALDDQRFAALEAQRQKIDEIKDSNFELAKSYSIKSDEDERVRTLSKQKDLLIEQKQALEEISNISGTDLTDELELTELLIQKIDGEIRKVKPIEVLPPSRIINKKRDELEKTLKSLKDAEKIGIDTSAAQARITKELEEATKNPFKVDIELEKIDAEITVEPKVKVKKSFSDVYSDLDDLGEEINAKMLSVLESDELQGALQGSGIFFNELSSIISGSVDIQVQALQDQIDARQEFIDELATDLEYEQRLKEKGLANSLDTKQEEYDTLLAEQESFELEQEKLKKEALKRQQQADSLSQVSSLITASAGIIKGFAPLGPFAVPLSIAAIATLFGLFAKTKIDAAKITKLYTGAKRIDDFTGYVEKGGKSDRSGEGFHVVDPYTGETKVQISGRERLLTELSSDTAGDEFFDNLEAGKYDNMDIPAILENYHREFTTKENVKVVNNTIVQKQNTSQWVAFTNNEGKTEMILVETKGKSVGSRIKVEI